MAIRSTNLNDYLKRTTNVVAASSNYTCVFWWRFTGSLTATDYRTPFITLDDPAIYTDGVAIYNYEGGGTTGLRVEAFPPVNNTALSIPTVNLWYPLTYTRNGNTHSFYLAGILIGTSTLNVSAETFAWLSILSDTFDTGTEAMEICRFREWNTALSLVQINAEINSPTAVHLTNLVTDTPLTSDLLDVSGNGNNWTAVGSPGFVADPAFPTNISLATATDIGSLPASLSQTVSLDSYVFTTWYKYQSNPANTLISIFPSGGFTSGSHYLPSASTYDSLGNLLYDGGTLSVVNQPIYSPGSVYYIKVFPSIVNIVPANLVLVVQLASNNAAPSGSILIIGDSVDNQNNNGPAAVLDSSNNNSILNYLPNFPSVSENGTTLPDGTMAVGTDDGVVDDNVLILDSSFNILHTVNLSGSLCKYISSDNVSLFYVLYEVGGHFKVQSLTTGGVLGGTIYDLGTTTIRGIAPSPDNTILYYQLFNNTTIKRWDLVNNIAMSNLTTGVGHAVCFDLLCNTDGSIIICDPIANTITQYNAAGSVLNTYTPVADLLSGIRMCLGINYTTILCWNIDASSPVNGTLLEVRISDGAVLVNKSYVTFQAGLSNESTTLTPVMFGPSNSCPIMVLRSAAPSGTIVVGKASNPLATGVVFTVNGPSGSFTIMTDTSPGEVITVAPGTYSIVEVADATYQPEYFVSNDPVNNDNLNIVVADGELVDVVIVNSLKTKFGGLYQLVNRTNDQLINQDGSLLLVKINWFYDLFIGRDK